MTAQAPTSHIAQTHAQQQAGGPVRASISQRQMLAAAFRALGGSVDPDTAFLHTKQWYRSAGAEWTRALTTTPMPTGEAANDPDYQPRVTRLHVTPAATRVSHRAILAKAFRALGHGAAPSVADRDTKDWYRSGGAEWTRALA